MGNLLDSDSSTASDSEITGQVRTDGDGMETDQEHLTNNDGSKLGTVFEVEHERNVSKPSRDANRPEPCLNISKKKRVISPKELPPLKDLIPLKPVRIGDVVPQECAPELMNQNTQYIPKQREPRFVPYEPYTGAVRPMGPPSPRRQSSGSSIALSDDASGTGSQTQTPKKILPNPSRQPTESSNMTLYKERLRISEKDVEELRIENARLKRLLVDSLSGSMLDSNHARISSRQQEDSLESLTNEIEVWKSKFLSSCVLVECLTKEKDELVRGTTAAAELFKDIKATVDLTPELYEQIKNWVSVEEKQRTLRKENSLSSLQDNDL